MFKNEARFACVTENIFSAVMLHHMIKRCSRMKQHATEINPLKSRQRPRHRAAEVLLFDNKETLG